MNHPIPAAALKKHIAIVGMTGSGKTSTAKTVVEQVVAEGSRVCILDPIKSDWWGLISSATGKSPGLPFRILGGPRGHVPLHPSAGKALGQIVGEGKLPLSIFDMADFDAGGLQQFFVDFAPSLMRHMKGVLYLVMEEAHEFAPKEFGGFSKESMGVHYAKKIATASRTRGIRMIVATQRVQALHNALLGSCSTIIAQNLSLADDQKPVVNWLRAHIGKERATEIEGTLAGLATGEGWIASGPLKLCERVKFPKFKTYDNNATPDDDLANHDVKTATVDQDELRAIVGDAIKDAEANDPKALKAEIAKLRAELAKKPATLAPIDRVVIQSDDKALAAAHKRGFDEGFKAGRIEGGASSIDMVASVHATCVQTMDAVFKKSRALLDTPTRKVSGYVEPKFETPKARSLPNVTPAPMALRLSPPVQTSVGGNGKMPKVERLILTALAQYPSGRTKNQMAILAGYAVNGGGFNNGLSSLRTKGFIEDRGGTTIITQAGLDALGQWNPLPHGDGLLQHWLGQLGKAERATLATLAAAYPNELSKEETATGAGYAPDGGGFNNALSRLRTLELISGGKKLRASEDLFG